MVQLKSRCFVAVLLRWIGPPTLPDLPRHALAKLVSLFEAANARKAEFGYLETCL